MAKLCFIIIALTLVTVAYGSLPRARKFLVPIRVTRPVGYHPPCVPRPCKQVTQAVDCVEPACVCDDVTQTCRDKECPDIECEDDDPCPSYCKCSTILERCYVIEPVSVSEPEPEGEGGTEGEVQICDGEEICRDLVNHTDCIGVCTCEEFEYENGEVGSQCLRPPGFESQSGSEK